MFHELSNCAQLLGESEHQFCLRAMSLREKVSRLSDEEELPFDNGLLRKRFFHTIFTGLKRESIRLELQHILKTAKASDEELLREISVATANESERATKIKSKADVNQLTLDSRNSSEKSERLKDSAKESKILIEISKLTTKVNELTSVRDELQDLKKQINSYNLKPMLPNGASFEILKESENPGMPNVNFPPRNSRRRFYRCKNCEITNSQFCNHCFNCGSPAHRRNRCDQKN